MDLYGWMELPLHVENNLTSPVGRQKQTTSQEQDANKLLSQVFREARVGLSVGFIEALHAHGLADGLFNQTAK